MITVGLELCGNTIKLAVVEAGGRGKMKVTAFESCKVDAKQGDTEGDIVSVLEGALKRAKAPTAQVVCSVRAQDCMIREILVPFDDDENGFIDESINEVPVSKRQIFGFDEAVGQRVFSIHVQHVGA